MEPRKAIWILNLGLLALLGYVVYGIVSAPGERRQGAVPASPAKRPTATAQPNRRPEADSGDLAAVNIFAPPPEKPKPRPRAPTKPKKPAEPAAPPLRLKLIGAVCGDPDVSRAVIEDLSTHKQGIYRIGDVVQQARITRIESDRVLLARAGKTEVLRLRTTVGGEAPRARYSPRVRGGPGGARSVVQALAPGSFQVSRRMLRSRMGGMSAILRATKFTPHVVDGKVKGLRVSGVDKIPGAGLIGIRDGDVIESVNGHTLNSLPKAYQVFQKARRQSFVNVGLLRGEQRRTLSFRVR